MCVVGSARGGGVVAVLAVELAMLTRLPLPPPTTRPIHWKMPRQPQKSAINSNGYSMDVCSMYVYVCTHVQMYVCTYVCTVVNAMLCMYVCTYVCTVVNEM